VSRKQTTVLQPGEQLTVLTVKIENVMKWNGQTETGLVEWLFKQYDDTGIDKG
jgi:hypothetical protein